MAMAALAPMMAAAGGTSVIATALPAISAIAGGFAANAEAKSVEEQNKVNAHIGRTRAIQTDVAAREGMSAELGTLRATFAANGQRPTVGTETVFNELRRVRGRDRRIEFGNRMQEASSYNMAAKSAKSAGRASLIGGFIKAAPSVFDVYEMKKRGF